jgi:glycosyltransferase involved in cell wall biosynthesis
MNKNLKFTIIIPSYNEKEDVRLAIESSIKQRYPDKEILVIDDSTDNTPQIIREYVSRGVVLLDGPRKGCCGARNFGIKKASGDVVVLLNADVVLPPDFLEKIKKHYEAGADYVLVESRVFNQENIWARFIEMQHRYESRKIGDKAEWTEGFSCRREAALKVGLIPGDFPIRFCRDWFLGKRLNEAGFKKVIDRSIVVTHKAPDNFKEYWQVRKVRGRFSASNAIFFT